MTVGILGGAGMLGGDLVHCLGDAYRTDAITLENYAEKKGGSYDILINANGNSRRFWANEHPFEDFEASTLSVVNSIRDFSFKHYVYISSSDVYERHESPDTTREDQVIIPERLSHYGFHKYLSEAIVRHYCPQFIILRASMMIGRNLVKGPIFDIAGGKPLFISLDSCLQAISTEEVAGVIAHLLKTGYTNGVLNMGGIGAFDLSDLKSVFTGTVSVAPGAERQQYHMDVSRLGALYALKRSEEYIREFFSRPRA
jgi:nucleoside-diphosphate-sugar epimerase